jgi:uncharacterized protein DUF6644
MNRSVGLEPFLAWVQTTPVATTIGQSLLLTGFLSGIHLLGLTLLVGGAVVASLRMLGVILTDQPITDVTRAPRRGMAVGLTISVASGLLLFAPKAAADAENSLFQLKMLVLLTAAVFHFTLYQRISRRPDAAPLVVGFSGGLGLMLWFGVAVAGCAFILLE